MSDSREYPLPLPFPDGRVWAAIRDGAVLDMAYMAVPEGVLFHVYRQQARGRLARQGRVVTGEVIGGRFVARAEHGCR